jgi:hypothetical protein
MNVEGLSSTSALVFNFAPSGNYPYEDLTKFGYQQQKWKQTHLIMLLYCWLPAGTYLMIIKKKKKNFKIWWSEAPQKLSNFHGNI